jgi:hypothetical protein
MRAKPIQQLNTGYSGNGYSPVISFQQGSQIQLYSMRLINGNATASDLAVMQGLSQDAVTVYTYTSPTLADVTNTLLAGGNVALFNATAGSGIIIETQKKIQAFMVNVSVNQSGANTFAIQYSNGSGFTNVLQTVNVPTTFNGAPTGKQIVFFSPGVDYATGCGITGTDTTQYQIKFNAVSAGSTCSINELKAAVSVAYTPSVAQNSSLELLFSEQYPLLLEGGESIIPFFKQASNDNKVMAFYQYQD